MDLRLEGRTAFVLGAGGGLGGAIARAVTAEGARIALADIDAAAVGTAAADIEASGARA